MDCKSILTCFAIGCFLGGDRVSAYYNRTSGDYTFILPRVSVNNSQGRTALANAQDWCGINTGSTLATIPSKKVQNYVTGFISLASNDRVMNYDDLIILNGKLNTSLPGTWVYVNGNPINGVTIQDERNVDQLYFYGFLKTNDYKIYASAANNERPFICEKPGSASDCAAGLSLNGRCYQVKTRSLSWYSARNDCLDEGGDLASFETLNDTTFASTLGTLLANTSQTEYWVGVQCAEWRWEDTGLAMKYTNWESGSPNNTFDCLGIRHPLWLWFTFDCSLTYRFICLATNGISTTPTIRTSSDASQTASVTSPPSSHTSSVVPSSDTSKSSPSSTHATNGITTATTSPTSSDASQTASATSDTSSVLPSLDRSTSKSSPSSTHASLALPLGLGIVLGIGAIIFW